MTLYRKIIMTALIVCLTIFINLTATRADEPPDCSTTAIENTRDTIAFKPFLMEDPVTGRQYAPDEILTLENDDGEIVQITAQAFFEELNRIELNLNKMGYSIRNDEVHTLAELYYCYLPEQAEIISEGVRPDTPSTYRKAFWEQLFNEKLEEMKNDLATWVDLYHLKVPDIDEDDYYFPEVPPYTPQTPAIKPRPLEVIKEKSWNYEIGEKSKFYLAGGYGYKAEGSAVEVAASGYGRVDTTILKDLNKSILDAKAGVRSPGSLNGYGFVSIRVFGKEVGAFNWTQPSLKVDGGGKDLYKIDQSLSYRFSIGPVPMKAKVGFRGGVGYRWLLEIAPLQAGASVTPYAHADAYAQAGADVGVASAGVGGKLVLVSAAVPIMGAIAFQYIDQPELVYSLSADADLDALSGELYAYAKINYIWDTWKGKFSLYKWKGFKKTGNIFNYEARYTPAGLIASGDLSADDFVEISEINRQRAVEQLEAESSIRSNEVVAYIYEDLIGENSRHAIQGSERLKAILDKEETILRQWGDIIDDLTS